MNTRRNVLKTAFGGLIASLVPAAWLKGADKMPHITSQAEMEAVFGLPVGKWADYKSVGNVHVLDEGYEGFANQALGETYPNCNIDGVLVDSNWVLLNQTEATGWFDTRHEGHESVRPITVVLQTGPHAVPIDDFILVADADNMHWQFGQVIRHYKHRHHGQEIWTAGKAQGRLTMGTLLLVGARGVKMLGQLTKGITSGHCLILASGDSTYVMQGLAYVGHRQFDITDYELPIRDQTIRIFDAEFTFEHVDINNKPFVMTSPGSIMGVDEAAKTKVAVTDDRDMCLGRINDLLKNESWAQ